MGCAGPTLGSPRFVRHRHRKIVQLREAGFQVSDRVDSPRVVCIIHTMNSKELIRRLLQAGWVLRGTKGSHRIYTHPQRGGHISVPHPKKDLGAGLMHKLLKQAGLK